MFERLLSVPLRQFMVCSGVLPTTQFSYRKGLGTCDALFMHVPYTASALKSGLVARIVQIDFNAAFDGVNDQGILNKLCSVGIRGSASVA